MSKDNVADSFWHEFFQFGLYKRNQGRIARQITFVVLAASVAIGCWRLSDMNFVAAWGRSLQVGIPLAIFAIGTWLSYRLVNLPKFADFLIAVEAEMVKVSWPTWPELVKSSIVVLIVIIGLAIVLWGYDLFWGALLKFLKVTG